MSEDWTTVSLPSMLWGGKPRGLLIDAGYQVREASGGAFRIRTEESYTRSHPNLMYVRDLEKQPTELDRLGQNETLTPTLIPERFRNEVERLERFAANDDLTAIVDLLRLQIGSCTSGQLRETAEAAVRRLRGLSAEDTPLLPSASAHAVVRDHRLSRRFAIIRALARFSQDPRSAGGDGTDLLTGQTDRKLTLTAAANGLAGGEVLGLTYLGPLLGAASPRMWGFAATREPGPIVFSFGRLVNGHAGRTAELLQTLYQGGARHSPPEVVKQGEASGC